MPNTTLSPPECSCIKMGSNESHFNASLIVRDGDNLSACKGECKTKTKIVIKKKKSNL